MDTISRKALSSIGISVRLGVCPETTLIDYLQGLSSTAILAKLTDYPHRFVLRDPRLWGKDSQDFNPNRFLASQNPSVDQLPDIWSIPFGFGRR